MPDSAYCSECNNKYRVFDECPECLVKLQKPSINQKITGDKNQVIFVNGENTGSIHIGTQSEEPDQTTYIHRCYISPLKVGGIPVKSWWPIVAGGLGLLGSLARIISFISSGFNGVEQGVVPSTMNLTLYFGTIIVSMSLFTSGFMIQRKKHLKIPFLTFEVDKLGNIYRSKIVGKCGFCGHPVKLVNRNSETEIQCTYYPDQHRIAFEHAKLEDVGEDFIHHQQ